MKANIKNAKRIDDGKIILSIGMIVKNEEKHLDNCLSALQKLRDNVSSELIIVDTGSTDRTKEIALKYTDKVYDFEWINDFAAARNFGLKKAVGEWFMFIDADEYLDEDCEEMIKFFSIPEVRAKYNSATVNIINYNKHGNVINQFFAGRLERIRDGLRFDGKIHEHLPGLLPTGMFTTNLHHYGYAYTSLKDKQAKSKRNLKPILDEYNSKPDDLRVLCHLCDAINFSEDYNDFESKEKIYLEYLEKARNNINDIYAPFAFIKAMNFYIADQKCDNAIKVAEEYLNLDYAPTSITSLSVYFLISLTYIEIKDFERAYEYSEKYFEYYDKYKAGKLSMLDLRFGALKGLTKSDYQDVIMSAARALNALERYDESLEHLDRIDISKVDYANLKVFLNIYRDLLKQTKNYKYLTNLYQKILALGDDDKTGLVLFLMEQYYMENYNERDGFVSALADSGVDGKYIELMKLVRDDKNGVDIKDKLTLFIDSIDRWNEGYSEALFLAMKHKLDISATVHKLSHNVLKDLITTMSGGHFSYSEVALSYCENVDICESIRMMLWGVSVLEAGVHRSNELEDDRKAELFDFFICTLSDYIFNIYNPELLNPEDVEVLPELHRFGYYMTLAFTAKENGDLIAYIRTLKDALKLCEPMKDLVSFYLSEFEKELKASE